MKKWKTSALTMAVILSMTAAVTAQAGDINGNEAAIIGAASGTFSYNGRSYVAKGEYLGQLQGKLAEDGIDLSAEQANELISEMYASVGAGVTQGYLELVGGDEPDTEPVSTEEPVTDTDKKEPDTKKTPDTKETPDTPKAEQTGTDGNPAGGDFSVDGLFAGQESREEEENQNPGESESVKDSKNESKRSKNSKKADKTTANGKAETEDTSQGTKAESDKDMDGKECSPNTENTGEDSKKTGKENSSSFGGFAEGKGAMALLIGIIVLVLGILGGIGFAAYRRHKRLGSAAVPEGPYIDMHSHVLPGVDDGSPDMETSMEMIGVAYDQGIRVMIATPHYHIGHYHLKAGRLDEIYLETKAAAEEKYPDFRLYLGNEVFYSDGIVGRLDEKRALTLSNSQYVLVEFRVDEAYRCVYEAVLQFVRSGYTPVIAHVERYRNVVNSQENLDELHKAGALLQMNVMSIKKSGRLLKNGDIDFLATDCHDMQLRKPEMRTALPYLCEVCDSQQIHKILVSNPQCILDNKYI